MWAGAGRLGECVKDDMILLGLYHCSLNGLGGLSVPNKHAHKCERKPSFESQL